MKSKKGLQRVTETDTKINKVLSLEQITPKDLETFSEPESSHLSAFLTEKLNELKGDERDRFIEKIEAIMTPTTKNQLWEYSHTQITWAISALMQEYGRMPTKTEIASKTGLSRKTVHKHIKEYANHPQHQIQMEQFRFMTSKVLAKVFQYAVNGDVGAAKLYFNLMGCLNSGQPSTSIKTQNNYIQINGMVLSQETIGQLSAEQLTSIEIILRTALPQRGNGELLL